ncbi:MAG: sensor histidine kinase [Candidatus Kapaibacteriota bacterium]
MNHFRTALLFIFLCLCGGGQKARAQAPQTQAPEPPPAPISLTTAKDYRSIFDGHAEILIDSNRTFTPEQAMANTTQWRLMKSENDISFLTGHTYWIRFRVRASPEAARALHGEGIIAIPFSYARHLDCYLLNPTTTATTPYSIQYSGLDVPADDRPVWWFGNTFRIPLDTLPHVVYLRSEGIVAVVTQGYVVSEVQLLNAISWFRAFYFATTGILLALFLYNVFLYFIVRDRVYLYYLGYVAFLGGFFFFYESGFLFEMPLFSRSIARANPLAFFPILHLGFAFTLLFTDTLLTLPRVAPRWSKVLRVLAVVQLVFMLVEWSFIGADRYRTFPIFYPLGNLSFLINLGCFIIAAVLALRKRVFITWYYLFGWAVTFFAIIGYNISLFKTTYYKFIEANIMYRIGIVIEMIIFSVALAERIRVLQREKAHAAERERERISRDLHDGLGAQIVEIAAMSEQLREEVHALQANGSAPQQGVEWATAITENVHALRNGLRETIWVLSAENDTVEALVAYLRQETRRMLEAAQIQVIYDIPMEFPTKPVPPDTRRNIAMACREACTNIMKHAEATEVSFRAVVEKSHLVLTLHDDGRGFAPSDVQRFSNGLKTMERRMSLVGGAVRMDSAAGKGTTVEFRVPFG